MNKIFVSLSLLILSSVASAATGVKCDIFQGKTQVTAQGISQAVQSGYLVVGEIEDLPINNILMISLKPGRMDFNQDEFKIGNTGYKVVASVLNKRGLISKNYVKVSILDSENNVVAKASGKPSDMDYTQVISAEVGNKLITVGCFRF